MNYSEINELKDIYLEDSYVLKILESRNEIIFELDAVLTQNHPAYDFPKLDEKY